jgi:MFS family permease
LTGAALALGIRANSTQFTLLIAVNVFVGAMVGVERSVLPVVATTELAAAAWGGAMLVAIFGAAKACANLSTQTFVRRLGRRNTLVLGWLIALPVPLLLWGASSLVPVLAANALLGLSQGLTWSMTLLMKVDLAGPRRRGFATGVNEFAGYLGVGVAAYLAAVAASFVDLRAGPALLAIAIGLAGLLLSLRVRDTSGLVALESDPFARPSRFIERFAVYQAGFCKNANDGVAWAFVPLLLAQRGADLRLIGAVAGIYPVTWAVMQLFAGSMSDLLGRRALITTGMFVQASALMLVLVGTTPAMWLASAVVLGAGTAMVYPTLLAAAADLAPPRQRPRSLAVYRFWRDGGIVAGALVGGVLISAEGLGAALVGAAIATGISGLLALGIRDSVMSKRGEA